MWIDRIEPIVQTRLNIELTKKIGSKYSNLNVTTVSTSNTDSKFPNVYVQELGGSEEGQTLDGLEINAINSTFQIEVTDNQSQGRAKDVMSEVVSIMKTMRFSVVTLPEAQNTEVYRYVARFRRIIGHGDTL